jgi:hypothetical protein
MSAPDDRELEEFLKGESEISRAYSQGAREAPPPRVDDAVLRLAREDDEAQRRAAAPLRSAAQFRQLLRLRRWQWPLAVAATMVLAFSALLSLRDDHGARSSAMMESQVTAEPRPAANAPSPVAAPERRTDQPVAAAAPAAPPPPPDPARSRERNEVDRGSLGSARAQVAPTPEMKEKAEGGVAAKAEEEPAAVAERTPEMPAPADLKDKDRDALVRDAAPAASVAQGAGRQWASPTPEMSLRKSAVASEALSCPPEVFDCNAWRSAQRSLETIYARDQARRARCYRADCPVGSTITAEELATVSPAFAGESSVGRLRGRWQTELSRYAFSDNYLLQWRKNDDGSNELLLRPVRYHLIAQGIEVLENNGPADAEPVVILRVAYESSRSLRLLDAQGEPHGNLVPATEPLDRWVSSASPGR